ncbi:hypothetical protein ACK1JC_10575 [Acinetobacter sp. TY2]|uniref:hypothetical protein n=1 Tax=Acinetobacter sp. TY2 TaxID=3387403 RepID=UPI0039178B37
MREQFEEGFKHTYAYEVISSKVSDPLSFCERSGDYKYTVVQAGWGAWQHQETTINDLKAQLNNMEQCYIQIKQELNELIAFNTEIDCKQKSAEKTAEKYKFKVSMIADLLRDCSDQDMTLKAIKTVIDRVGES